MSRPASSSTFAPERRQQRDGASRSPADRGQASSASPVIPQAPVQPQRALWSCFPKVPPTSTPHGVEVRPRRARPAPWRPPPRTRTVRLIRARFAPGPHRVCQSTPADHSPRSCVMPVWMVPLGLGRAWVASGMARRRRLCTCGCSVSAVSQTPTLHSPGRPLQVTDAITQKRILPLVTFAIGVVALIAVASQHVSCRRRLPGAPGRSVAPGRR